MKKILKVIKEGKKNKVLGEPHIISQEEYEEMELDGKVELIQALIPLGLMHVANLLEAEVAQLAGAKYSRSEGNPDLVRYGKNPTSVKLAGQRHPITVPRVRNRQINQEVPLNSWHELKGSGEVDEILMNRVLYGISCRNYEKAAESVPGAIGLSSSTVSRQFVEASAEKLKALNERDLSAYDIVALYLDGKTFAEDTMVIALGVTMTGEKIILGFVQTGTENASVLTDFLNELRERGLRIEEGILAVIDGGKGLHAALKKAFKGYVLIQRCQWHKRENVVSYLPKQKQESMRRRLRKAQQKPTYEEAKKALKAIVKELGTQNLSAARSLEEGLEETLMLHRLGVFELLGLSLRTTNCLESINSQVEERCGKVDCWKNSSQKQRWLASALLDIEPRLRTLMGYRHLPLLREKIKQELKLERKDQVA